MNEQVCLPLNFEFVLDTDIRHALTDGLLLSSPLARDSARVEWLPLSLKFGCHLPNFANAPSKKHALTATQYGETQILPLILHRKEIEKSMNDTSTLPPPILLNSQLHYVQKLLKSLQLEF